MYTDVEEGIKSLAEETSKDRISSVKTIPSYSASGLHLRLVKVE
jgi:hypothetical protein